MRKINLIAVLLVAFIFLLGGCGSLDKSADKQDVLGQTDSVKTEINEAEDKFVFLTISAKSAANNLDKVKEELRDEKIIPKDGLILPKSKIELMEGDSVIDILKRVCKEKNIHMEVKAVSGGFEYVQGINNLYELSAGPGSGWLYKVNGEIPQVSASEQVLNSGDDIVFEYTCDFGKDI